jgi:hypothetical protein
MAAPVVSATIALMLQANPTLTPNLVKAVLQFTAESQARYDELTQGAGFLNARGAVELAQSVAAGASIEDATRDASSGPSRDAVEWGRRIIWGNQRVGGGRLVASASAWRTDVVWGSPLTPEGNPVAFGARCADAGASTSSGARGLCDLAAATGTVSWGALCAQAECSTIAMATAADADASTRPGASNIVWGTQLLDDTANTLWRAPAIRRPSRVLLVDPALR